MANSTFDILLTLALNAREITFTASGTYTPTPGMKQCLIECVGGGAGGCGIPASGGGNIGGTGGGSGSYSQTLATAADIGASKSVTIGTGGAGGTAGGGAGGNGSATSVGSLCVANGGFGGTYYTLTTGGAGGTAGTGNILAIPGEFGRITQAVGNNQALGMSGSGGSTIFGAGGAAVVTNSTAIGRDGTGYGSGGSGGASYTSGSTVAGGAGRPGFVKIIEFF